MLLQLLRPQLRTFAAWGLAAGYQAAAPTSLAQAHSHPAQQRLPLLLPLVQLLLPLLLLQQQQAHKTTLRQ
jgi:hypothetical protein